jgi:hypothetical protein
MNQSTQALGKQIAKKIVVSVLGWSGPQGFITRLILQKVIIWGIIQIEDLYVVWKVKQEIKEKVKDYETVINNPDTTAQQFEDAFHKLLNG